jgi:hypothetical protein
MLAFSFNYRILYFYTCPLMTWVFQSEFIVQKWIVHSSCVWIFSVVFAVIDFSFYSICDLVKQKKFSLFLYLLRLGLVSGCNFLEIFFWPFTLNPCLFLPIWCISCRQQLVDSCFCNPICHSLSLIRELRPFSFRVVVERYVVFPAILLFLQCLIVTFSSIASLLT